MSEPTQCIRPTGQQLFKRAACNIAAIAAVAAIFAAKAVEAEQAPDTGIVEVAAKHLP